MKNRYYFFLIIILLFPLLFMSISAWIVENTNCKAIKADMGRVVRVDLEKTILGEHYWHISLSSGVEFNDENLWKEGDPVYKIDHICTYPWEKYAPRIFK